MGDMVDMKQAEEQKLDVNAADTVIDPKKNFQVFYDSNETETEGSKTLRMVRCNCFENKVRITTDQIQLTNWYFPPKACCVQKVETFDVDNIQDMQLVEYCGIGMCLFRRGDIKVFGQDGGDQTDHYFTCKHIENAHEVYMKMSQWVHKISDLRMGMSRPDDPSIPHTIYNSRTMDTNCVKCSRTMLCCGCFRKSSAISKSGVTVAQWRCCPTDVTGKKHWSLCPMFITKRMDIDNIKDLSKSVTCCQACCDAGDIIIYGQDADQHEESYKIGWVSNVNDVFGKFNKYQNLLNNRERVGFTT